MVVLVLPHRYVCVFFDVFFFRRGTVVPTVTVAQYFFSTLVYVLLPLFPFLPGSISAATILAEHLCLKIELRAIDVGFSTASKKKSRSKSSQPRTRDNSTFLPSSVSFGASISGGKASDEANTYDDESVGLSPSHASIHQDIELTSQTFSLLRNTTFDGLSQVETKSPNPSYSTALNLDRDVEEEGDTSASHFNLNFASQHPEKASRHTLTEMADDVGGFGRVDSPSFRALRQSIPAKHSLQVQKNTTSETNAPLPSGMISGFSLPSLPSLPIYSQNSGTNRSLNQSFTSLPNLPLLPPSQAGTPLKPLSKARPISTISTISDTTSVGQNGNQRQFSASQFGMSLPVLPTLPPLNSTFSTPMHPQKTSLNTAAGAEQTRIPLPQLHGNNQQRLAGQFYAPGLSSLAGTTTASTQEH